MTDKTTPETTPLSERLLNVSCDVLMYVVVFSWAAVALVLVAMAGGSPRWRADVAMLIQKATEACNGH